jgi:hypothetical protein
MKGLEASKKWKIRRIFLHQYQKSSRLCKACEI